MRVQVEEGGYRRIGGVVCNESSSVVCELVRGAWGVGVGAGWGGGAGKRARCLLE